MSSPISNDETTTINCDTNCDINCDINCDTNESLDITSPVTKIDDFIVVDDNKSELVNSIQSALDTARLACAFAVDMDKKMSVLLSQIKIIITLGEQTQTNVKKNKESINARLVTLKFIQKMKNNNINNNISPNSVKIAENFLLLANNVLETSNNSVKQITDMVTHAVDAKKTSISVGKAILTIKTAILTAQKIANSMSTLTQTVKDGINNALKVTKTALSDAIVADINISSLKSQSEITKVAAVNALTYSKKTKNSAKANITITKATLNNPNKIASSILVKPVKSIKDIQLKNQNTLLETNKIIERSNCIIRKGRTAKPTIIKAVDAVQKIIESLENVLSLLP